MKHIRTPFPSCSADFDNGCPNHRSRDSRGFRCALHDAGIRAVAISHDSPEVSRGLAREAAYAFAFLADLRHEAIARFDLLDPDENNAARSAELLVDSQGVVRWRMLTDSIYVRARPQQVLEIAKTFR